jgi:hypothetical protein
MIDMAAGASGWSPEILAKYGTPASTEVPPVPANVRARYDANAAQRETQFRELVNAVNVAPIFLCSTHGLYNLAAPLEKRVVPPNTWIFEAQSIGDLTLTSIDVPLWELLQGGRRYGFLRYMLGEYNEMRSAGLLVYARYKEVFRNLIIYKPGDEIYTRELSIGGGKGLRADYSGMGFFRFDVNGPQYPYKGYGALQADGSRGPYEILRRLGTQMLERDDRITTDCDLVDNISLNPSARNTFLNGEAMDEDFRLAWPSDSDPTAPKIFVFSSCAAVSDNMETQPGLGRWAEIATLQRERILESWLMGVRSVGGGAGGDPTVAIKKGLIRRGPTTRGMVSGSFVFEPAAAAIAGFAQENSNLGDRWASMNENETEGGKRSSSAKRSKRQITRKRINRKRVNGKRNNRRYTRYRR